MRARAQCRAAAPRNPRHLALTTSAVHPHPHPRTQIISLGHHVLSRDHPDVMLLMEVRPPLGCRASRPIDFPLGSRGQPGPLRTPHYQSLRPWSLPRPAKPRPPTPPPAR